MQGDEAEQAQRAWVTNRVQPLLPTDSPVRHVIIGQTGPHPWFWVVSLLAFLWIRHRMVCVTDEAIYVLKGGAARGQVLATLPRHQRIGPIHIGPVAGRWWGSIYLPGGKLWVKPAFYAAIEGADATKPDGPRQGRGSGRTQGGPRSSPA